jgi:hypothetical protein
MLRSLQWHIYLFITYVCTIYVTCQALEQYFFKRLKELFLEGLLEMLIFRMSLVSVEIKYSHLMHWMLYAIGIYVINIFALFLCQTSFSSS